MAPLSNLIGTSSAVSMALSTFAPAKAAAASEKPTVVAHAAAEGKIKMYSNEFYAACGIGGWVLMLMLLDGL
jgi:hypothetical protein